MIARVRVMFYKEESDTNPFDDEDIDIFVGDCWTSEYIKRMVGNAAMTIVFYDQLKENKGK